MTLGMSDFIFAPPAPASLPVIGQDRRFPVGRIFCVGRNYAAHAAEMGSEVDREAPFYFLKSLHAVQQGGGSMPYPPGTSDLHHEIELVVGCLKRRKLVPDSFTKQDYLTEMGKPEGSSKLDTSSDAFSQYLANPSK